MVALANPAPENLDIPQQEQMQQEEDDELGSEISDYELCREERIRENRERMQKLGIFSLSQQLKPSPVRSYRKAPRLHNPLPPSPAGPTRRSSRLQSSTPVTYCEIDMGKKEKSVKEWREEGSRPEVYTEEHDKLLGSTEMSWTLFVDGYGKDGKRIYDPINGKTCHQCRQKTLGQRTHCSSCNMVQGQFCGDCLYMRYGENVIEAKANPDWICPVCRGICNCSLCRQGKGWPPTGMLYKKIANLGYKSVAHYLVQTRRADTDKESNAGSKVPVSAKRSLPFSDIEVTGEEGDLFKPSDKCPKPLPDPVDAALAKDQVEHQLKPEVEEDSAGCDDDKETIPVAGTACINATEPLNDEAIAEALERGCDIKCVAGSETSPKPTKKRGRYEPAPDSIGGRLRMRRKEPQLGGAIRADTTADVGGIASRLRKRRRA
ncbi:cell division cycle-associated protein 7-like [Salvia hispanica]|uniref:cell division cycle-associated protein 7-like n=1 Tax=Salvia hispanica TaxID=49212 RepID=UPI002009AA39|nr:cell division cycle-associated protein 7-like [Salvia hispanica]